MCILNILFGFISEDVAALMGILYTMSLQVPVFLSWLALPNCPASFPRPDFSMPFNVWGPRWSGGFPFWPFGFQRHGPCEAWNRIKNHRRARCSLWFLRNKTTWNEMKRNEMIVHTSLFGWSVISKVVALSSTVQSWVWTMVGLGSGGFFFCWPKKRTWGKIRAVEHGTFFLAEVRLFKTFGKIVPAMNFRFCDVSFERRRCV